MHQLQTGPELDDALRPYAEVERRPTGHRPWVLANMVCGLDGSAAVGGRVGALSSPVDRQLFLDLRAVADVVVVGAETARRERYGPVRLSADRCAERKAAGRSPLPALAIVSRSLDLDPTAAVFTATADAPRTMVITSEASDAAKREALAAVADVVTAGELTVDLALALAELGRRGARIVLTEGGPTLLGELVAADLLDEMCLTLAPLMGGDPLPVAVRPVTTELTEFALRHALADGSNLFLRYERDRDRGRG